MLRFGTLFRFLGRMGKKLTGMSRPCFIGTFVVTECHPVLTGMSRPCFTGTFVVAECHPVLTGMSRPCFTGTFVVAECHPVLTGMSRPCFTGTFVVAECHPVLFFSACHPLCILTQTFLKLTTGIYIFFALRLYST